MKVKIELFISLFILISCGKERVSIITSESCSPRIQFGADKLSHVLREAGYKSDITNKTLKKCKAIFIRECTDTLGNQMIMDEGIEFDTLPGKEGFVIQSSGNITVINGTDASGALYGCIELADRIKQEGKIPEKLSLIDQPEMVLRGTCIGLQKTTYLPGRKVYEYPYTPENFPWFYDKALWTKYLDMLVENRMNSLYLWNGHPFASLVKLKDYPYAVEVDDSTFALNEEIYGFITKEANKRGIFVIQMFYNIIVSKPFADHHGMETQDRSRPIIPVISDYTRKSIAAFIEKYPNVGLMVCLGEAIGNDEDDIEWFTKTIIPGVKDGLKALGRTDEPPLVLRGHDTKADKVMEAALPLYKNLYTTHKYNGESLTTYKPRDSWASIHQGLSKLGSVHISNVHILANLEPFRYGSPDFIQKSVMAMHDIQGANGLHLYPQASYWDWPYTADNVTPRLEQVDRDWIWYKAWARYAWNCRRNKNDEMEYWTKELGEYYGCDTYGADILKAYEETGEIAPKLLRRFGISDGNRQTLLLGMFMSQLVNPYKWRVYSNFYSSNGPEGEILLDYAEKEWYKQPHVGETPPQIIQEVVEHGILAKEAIQRASNHVTKNMEEFNRLKNDVHCYGAFANFFAAKVEAAMLVLRYKYSNDIEDLENASQYLQMSVDCYDKLVSLTKETYLYANSMQTKQRRIPIDGTDGKYKTWMELLPLYEDELDNFKRNIESLKSLGDEVKNVRQVEAFQPVNVELLGEGEFYSIKKGQKVYADQEYKIEEVANELKNLKGVKLTFDEQREKGSTLRFRNAEPVKVVVGYFNGHSNKILMPPTLETDAHANDRGQADIKIANALDIPGLYPVNIYTYYYEPGENVLQLDKGIALILGFMEGDQEIRMRDAGIGRDENIEVIDWLFY